MFVDSIAVGGHSTNSNSGGGGTSSQTLTLSAPAVSANDLLIVQVVVAKDFDTATRSILSAHRGGLDSLFVERHAETPRHHRRGDVGSRSASGRGGHVTSVVVPERELRDGHASRGLWRYCGVIRYTGVDPTSPIVSSARRGWEQLAPVSSALCRPGRRWRPRAPVLRGPEGSERVQRHPDHRDQPGLPPEDLN